MSNLELWLRELETTGSHQAHESLIGEVYPYSDDPEHTEVGYCCLGIGCELMGLPLPLWQGLSLAPDQFVEWLGIPILSSDLGRPSAGWDIAIDFPEYVEEWVGRGQITAAGLNDTGCTFKQIAQTIRYFGVRGAM
jgi:hypothetical protein